MTTHQQADQGMDKMNDKRQVDFWLWGQDANSHQESPANEYWKLPEGNTVDPAEGARYLGLKNICRVVMNGKPLPPFDEESRKLQEFSQVVWSAMGDMGSVRNNETSDLEAVLRQAALYPNVTGAVMDDFFTTPSEENGHSYARYTQEKLQHMRDCLKRAPRPLDFWLVWYAQQLQFPIGSYLDLFDVITFWNMNSVEDYPRLSGNLEQFVKLTPGKRRYAGFYLWNYCGGRPLTADEFRYEIATYERAMAAGDIQGIVFCSNCVCGFDLEAVELARQWIRRHN